MGFKIPRGKIPRVSSSLTGGKLCRIDEEGVVNIKASLVVVNLLVVTRVLC